MMLVYERLSFNASRGHRNAIGVPARVAWLALVAVAVACGGNPVAPTTSRGGRVENLQNSITFRLTDACRQGEISIKFFDRTRGFVWPSSTTRYTLNGDTRAFELACDEGAQMCLGAWLTSNPSRIWGVGQTGNESCQGCCRTCGTRPDPINLEC